MPDLGAANGSAMGKSSKRVQVVHRGEWENRPAETLNKEQAKDIKGSEGGTAQASEPEGLRSIMDRASIRRTHGKALIRTSRSNGSKKSQTANT